ncbi:DUF2332 family protein [Arthrobacter sp. NPDC056727]|uniref:DUF2332 family protein n=1 Tax=Arthrobacter sp. NPDC056727 TaxID=3345927 RepID=UPI00366C2CB6
MLRCRTRGPVPLPGSLPHVAWRAGIDLNPLDVRSPDDVAWLEALVWPEPRAAAAGHRRRPRSARVCHWLSNEGETVIIQEDGSSVLPEMDPGRLRGNFLLQHNGQPVAITGPHGQSLDWF